MNTEQPIYQKLKLLQYQGLESLGKALSTDNDGNLTAIDVGGVTITGMASVQLNDVDNPAIVIKTGGGKIEILDFQSDFGSIITRNMVRADINVKIAGVWADYSNVVAQITRSSDGTHLLTASWYLNITETIEAIKASIY